MLYGARCSEFAHVHYCIQNLACKHGTTSTNMRARLIHLDPVHSTPTPIQVRGPKMVTSLSRHLAPCVNWFGGPWIQGSYADGSKCLVFVAHRCPEISQIVDPYLRLMIYELEPPRLWPINRSFIHVCPCVIVNHPFLRVPTFWHPCLHIKRFLLATLNIKPSIQVPPLFTPKSTSRIPISSVILKLNVHTPPQFHTEPQR